MAVKERHIGALYIDGKKVADKCEEIVETVIKYWHTISVLH